MAYVLQSNGGCNVQLRRPYVLQAPEALLGLAHRGYGAAALGKLGLEALGYLKTLTPPISAWGRRFRP
jgi:hypothetical protein